MKKVQIYTSPTCHYCHLAKDFFAGNAIPFEEFDVMADVEKRQEMIEKSGQMGVPVIVVDETEVIVGFDEKHLKALLGV